MAERDEQAEDINCTKRDARRRNLLLGLVGSRERNGEGKRRRGGGGENMKNDEVKGPTQ